ncbi:MAG TPA: UDP-N-acetylmuramoyl-L-alanyl-D-glutamate--2,6-diaminopimelate ligase [Rectinemataceae bacterium]|nr:UDP-N-acetylmuramoyl-L-alanyl-D-glutamate--2,6-diaminopimelate ligase [Rectinemataceae bacterium]
MAVPLSVLASRLDILELKGGTDVGIEGLAYDSRAVGPGFLFFALPGLHDDGERWIPAAIAAGAVAIVHRNPVATPHPGVAYLRVAEPRAAMSPAADAFHASPSRALAVIGVTGTEGKSTTVYLIWQLLNLAGRRAGFFSTVMTDTGSGELPNPEHQTTPEATAVQRMLASMRDAGMEFAIVEASSHGLSPRTSRLADVAFDVGVFMNVRHEHLEFHGSWEQYRDDKAKLFRALDAEVHRKAGTWGSREVPSFGVVCADDPSAPYFAAATGRKTYGFSSKGGRADCSAHSIRSDEGGSSFVLECPEGSFDARIELPGAFNVDNVLAALATVSKVAGISMADLIPLLPRLRPVRGRMTAIKAGQPFEVIVDYAHTPSSFEAIFPPLRERARGRIISLFGSAGERDRVKRPQQGAIAARFSDIVILSDEDPRGEDPMALLEEIAAGCQAAGEREGAEPGRPSPATRRGEGLFLIPDRRAAIRRAFGLARKGDIVLLLGKGHENSIIYRDGAIAWDEIAEARMALAELGFAAAKNA